MDYGNTKTTGVRRRLGGATQTQLAFPGESNPNFPREKSQWDDTDSLKKINKKVSDAVPDSLDELLPELLLQASLAALVSEEVDEDGALTARLALHRAVLALLHVLLQLRALDLHLAALLHVRARDRRVGALVRHVVWELGEFAHLNEVSSPFEMWTDVKMWRREIKAGDDCISKVGIAD